jgi:DNA polymerase III gamma/tau subunit
VEAFVGDISGEDRMRAYMVSGEHGIGKTTLARIGALQYLKSDDFNIREINASSDNGINMVRTMEEMCGSSTSQNRVWILDEFHSATKPAQKAILKLLEEGSDKDFFFICTTHPESVIAMIRSRCGQYPLAIPENIEIKRHLRKISKTEGIVMSPEITSLILEKAEGHIRDAVGFLQSVSKMEEGKALKYLKRVSGGVSESAEAYELVKAIYAQQGKKTKTLLKELKEAGENAEGIRRFVLSYGSSILINRWDLTTGTIMENFEEPYFDAPTAWPKFILDCFRSSLPGDDIPF